MNFKNLMEVLNQIEKDCLKLKQENRLTACGEGQFELIQIIKNHIKKKGVDD